MVVLASAFIYFLRIEYFLLFLMQQRLVEQDLLQTDLKTFRQLWFLLCKLQQVTCPAIAIRQKLADSKITRVCTYDKLVVIIWVFEYSSGHVHNQLLQFLLYQRFETRLEDEPWVGTLIRWSLLLCNIQ